MLREAIKTLMNHEKLTPVLLEGALHELLMDDVSDLQKAAFLVLLHSKGESIEDIVTVVAFFKQIMQNINCEFPTLDIVGTGGDGANTINISTGSALLAASCGLKVVKHGNRAVSSMAGSADVLEALGVNVHLTKKQVEACVQTIGFGFCYSPLFHPMLAIIKKLRRELNVPTTFNFLGPLLNPAEPDFIIVGVYQERLMSMMAETARSIQIKKALIVHGEGLDELSCLGMSKGIFVHANKVEDVRVDPRKIGLKLCSKEDLKGGDAHLNAALLTKTLSGEKTGLSETLILNAGYGIHLYKNMPIEESVAFAKDVLYQGKAIRLLKELREFTNE